MGTFFVIEYFSHEKLLPNCMCLRSLMSREGKCRELEGVCFAVLGVLPHPHLPEAVWGTPALVWLIGHLAQARPLR